MTKPNDNEGDKQLDHFLVDAGQLSRYKAQPAERTQGFSPAEVHEVLKLKDDEIRKLQKQANDNLMLKMDMERRLTISERQRDELLTALRAMVAAANRADVKMRDQETYAALPAARAAIVATALARVPERRAE